MKSITGTVVLALAVLSLPSQLAAQNYPMPGSSTEPPVICTTCGGAAKNKPTYPYSLPLKKFVGRYVDAQATRVYQHGFGYRSIRARDVFFVPERDRVYIRMGQTFAAYKLSTWFTQKLGQPLVRVNAFADPGLEREKYLPWEASVYPESQGWIAPYTDGNERLYGADFDDRGNCYLAYSVFGWGIVKDTGGATLEKTDQNFDPSLPAPTKIVVFKVNASYYAIVSDGGPGAYLYDVTNPVGVVGVPRTPLRQLNFGVLSFAKTTNHNVIAIVDDQFKLRLIAPDSIIAGSGGLIVPARSTGSNFVGVTSDGTNFYAAETKIRDSSLSVLVAGSNGFPNSYTETKYPVSGINLWGIHYGAGYVNIWGNDARGGNVKVYKLDNNVPREVDFGNFFQYYYTNPPEPTQTNPTVYARPDGNTATAFDAVVHEYQGKKYFIYSIEGLGDVYELEGGDSVDIEVKGTSFGTQNPSSPTKTQGPFYGDRITFKSTSSRSPMTLRWNFGNPEAPASENQRDVAANTDVSHRYTGLTTSAAITTPRMVVAQDVTASTTKDELTINLQTPIARMGIKNTDLLFIQPNASSAAQIVLGDVFTDSSDGTTEGHYGVWTFDGVNSSLAPTGTPPVGACGSHTVSLAASYAPYSGTIPSIPNASNYSSTAGPVSFTVRPFAAVIGIDTSLTTAAKLHFKNDTRVGTGVAIPTSVKWEHVAANGTVLDTKVAASYSLDKGPALAGSRVVMTVTASSTLPAGCESYTASQATYQLVAPDPKVDVTGCGNVGNDCKLTAGSIAGGSMSDWTYQWFLGGTQLVGETSNTLDLKTLITTAGTYQVKLRASNAITFTEVTQSLTVAAAVCVGKPDGFTVNYSVQDASQRKLLFSAYDWGRKRQPCDSPVWNFGDGSATSTEWAPSHIFPGNGPYNVKLTVSNINGSFDATTPVQFGSTPPPQPPPPQPPPPTGCSVSGGRVYPDYSGAASGCSTLNSATPCGVGEVITGRVSAFGSVLSASCPTNWNWGDNGVSTGLTSTHIYNQPGTYNVTVTYGDGATGAMTITVGGTPPPTPPPLNPQCTVSGGRVYPEYTGSVSNCTPLSSGKCRLEDIVNFRVVAFGGNLSASCTTTWDFGDGTTGTGLTPTHQYANPNIYTVNVTYGGTATGSILITVEAGNPRIPVPVNVGMSLSMSNPSVGAEITFTAAAESQASITAYNWNFGDGHTGSGQTVKHTYATKGDYDVSLTVVNEGGAAAPLIRRITVSDTPRYRFLLPVVVHAPGSNSSLWRTDLQIFDPNRTETETQPLSLTFEFNGQSKSLDLNSSTYIFEDFMTFFTDQNGAGTAIVTVSSRTAPQMWTRTYNVSASGIGTFGQVIPAISLDNIQNLATDSPAYVIAGVRSTQRYRTNLGLINLSLTATTATIAAFDDRLGIQLGEFIETLNPFQLVQVNNLSARIPLPADRPFSLRIASSNNIPLMVYGSMVDNVSNDPVFIMGVPEGGQSGTAMRTQVLPGVGHFGSWRTDATIFNPDTRGVTFKLRYFDSTGVKQAEADFAAAANTFIQLDDVLQSSAFTVSGDSVGFLQVETTSAGVSKYPIVFGRTYNDQQAAGTYGQGINAFASSNTNVRPGKPAYVPGIRNDSAYYTNAGVVNVSNETTIVLVSLLDKNTGAAIPLQPIMLAPYQSVIGNLLGNSTADSGTLKFEILQGGSVWAYASMVDKLTRDPEYIPAVPTP